MPRATIGQRFGSLVALEIVRGNRKALFRCDCGVEKWIEIGNVTHGTTKSCGCQRSTKGKERPSRQTKPFIDLSGRRYGMLSVIGYSHRENSRRMWKCRCDCGGEILVKEVSLDFGHKKSCGCGQYPSLSVGEKYGEYLVLSEAEPEVGTGRKMYLCRCTCGGENVVSGTSLRTGRQLRCYECAVVTHGESKTPMYRVYIGMRRRCSNPKEPSYKHYGGRGIRVCERWEESYENFLADMGPRPSDRHSIDRIDVNGNYEPGNCRWATWNEQSRNRRNNVFIEHEGARLCIADWSKKLGLNASVIGQRLARGLSPEEVLDTSKSKSRGAA